MESLIYVVTTAWGNLDFIRLERNIINILNALSHEFRLARVSNLQARKKDRGSIMSELVIV